MAEMIKSGTVTIELSSGEARIIRKVLGSLDGKRKNELGLPEDETADLFLFFAEFTDDD